MVTRVAPDGSEEHARFAIADLYTAKEEVPGELYSCRVGHVRLPLHRDYPVPLADLKDKLIKCDPGTAQYFLHYTMTSGHPLTATRAGGPP